MLKMLFLGLFLVISPLVTEKKEQPKLILYMQPGCPYCQKVLLVIKSLNIAVEMRDTTIPENKNFLIGKTNRATVPCLFIDDEPMFESKVIMQYLNEK